MATQYLGALEDLAGELERLGRELPDARTGLLCYVLGCPDNGLSGRVRSVQHRAFGLTTACEAHDPNRFDVGLPLSGPDPVAAVPAPAPRVDRPGGHLVAVGPPAPKTPPSGAAIEVARFTVPAAPVPVAPVTRPSRPPLAPVGSAIRAGFDF